MTSATAPKDSQLATLMEALEAAKRAGDLLHSDDASDELRNYARALIWNIERDIAMWHCRTTVAGKARLVEATDDTILWRVDVVVPEEARVDQVHQALTKAIPGGFHVVAYDDNEGLAQAWSARLGVFVVSSDE